jgi:hypothetical protein
MLETRPMQTKALAAYLTSKYTSLSAAIFQLGLNQKVLLDDTLSADVVGRVARLCGLTPEQLAALAAPFATA